jgi:hypothetical protein
MGKEAVVAYVKLLDQHFPGRERKKSVVAYIKLLSRYLHVKRLRKYMKATNNTIVSGPIFSQQ